MHGMEPSREEDIEDDDDTCIGRVRLGEFEDEDDDQT